MTDLGELYWTDGHEHVRLHLDSLRVRTRGAWLEAEIDLEPERAARRRLHLAVLSSVARLKLVDGLRGAGSRRRSWSS